VAGLATYNRDLIVLLLASTYAAVPITIALPVIPAASLVVGRARPAEGLQRPRRTLVGGRTRVVVAVTWDAPQLATRFAHCSPEGTVHDMPGEENGVSVVVCRDRLRSWREMWTDMRHYS
jgi:urea transporter